MFYEGVDIQLKELGVPKEDTLQMWVIEKRIFVNTTPV
jgi:hypothetical protein